MIQGAIFDLDGTVLDSTSAWLEAGSRYLRSLGITPEPDLGHKMFSMSLADSIQYLRTTYHLHKRGQEIIDGVQESVRSFYREEAEPKPGVRAFLEGLRQQGIPLTIATATERSLVLEGLRHTDLLSYFDGIFTCGEVGVGKQDPAVYRAAQEAMGTPVAETWVFEDAVHGVRTAHQAGFRVVGVFDRVSASQQDALRRYSDLYFEAFGDPAPFYRLTQEYEKTH